LLKKSILLTVPAGKTAGNTISNIPNREKPISMKARGTVLARALSFTLFIALYCPAMSQLKADFSASPQSGCAPLIVTFNNTSTGNPDSWKWDLGGGVTSTEQNPATSYFDPGVYTIKLIIYKGNATDTIVKTGVHNCI